MFKNRFVLVVAMLSILMVTLAVSSPLLGNLAGIPITGAERLSDYHERHPELRESAEIAVDTSDYFLRHPEVRPTADLSDYFLRH